MFSLKYIGLALAGYLIGSISFALIIGKTFYHTDVREHGSGNLGGTNTGRVLGVKAGFVVIALDVLKCLVPMLIINVTLGYNESLIYGLFVPIGHCYPIYTKFQGGKAVASSWGFVAGSVLPYFSSYWFVLVFGLITLYLIVKITKYVSLGSTLSFGVPVLLSIFEMKPINTITLLILWALIIWRHRSNIQRLLDHTEPKIRW